MLGSFTRRGKTGRGIASQRRAAIRLARVPFGTQPSSRYFAAGSVNSCSPRCLRWFGTATAMQPLKSHRVFDMMCR